MRGLVILFVHLIVTLARLAGPGGVRSVVAESLLIKQQLLILNRSRKRAPETKNIGFENSQGPEKRKQKHGSLSATDSTERTKSLRGAQYFPYFTEQLVWRERFFEKCHTCVQNSMMNNSVVGISRHE